MNIKDDPANITFDFQRYFPHKFWISKWMEDAEFPQAFCYKVLTVRDEAEQKCEIVLLRSYRDGSKEELHRARVPISKTDEAAQIFVAGLSKKVNAEFEEQNYSAAKTLAELNALAHIHGWHMDHVWIAN